MKETNRELLGEDIVDKTGEIYGLDEEGEVRSSYRPSGYPGVSPFTTCRDLICVPQAKT